MSAIPEELRRRRLAAGATQEDVARRLCVTKATVSGWETGTRACHSYFLAGWEQAVEELERALETPGEAGA